MLPKGVKFAEGMKFVSQHLYIPDVRINVLKEDGFMLAYEGREVLIVTREEDLRDNQMSLDLRDPATIGCLERQCEEKLGVTFLEIQAARHGDSRKPVFDLGLNVGGQVIFEKTKVKLLLAVLERDV